MPFLNEIDLHCGLLDGPVVVQIAALLGYRSMKTKHNLPFKQGVTFESERECQQLQDKIHKPDSCHTNWDIVTPGMGDTLREGWLFLSGLQGLQKENNSSGF